MSPIRLLLVDDHRIVREGLKSMLHTQPDMKVVGEAADGGHAISAATMLRPDIMLLDLELSGSDGLTVLATLHETVPEIKIIVLTAHATDERILDAVRNGAKGYLLKGTSFSDVLHAIRTVASGDSLFEPSVTNRLLSSVSRILRNEHKTEALTGREREILTLMAQGYGNKPIGEALHVAERTVKFYATIIFKKLGAGNRAEAVAIALRDRLIEV